MADLRFQDENLSIIEYEPQYRSIFVTYNEDPIRVPFPYLILVFNHPIVPGGYNYPGLYGQGLRVLFSPKTIESLGEIMSYSPTEHHHSGLCCTSHEWDNHVFKTKKLLIGTILDLWWQSKHHCLFTTRMTYEKWQKMTIEEALKFKWKGKMSLIKTMNINAQEIEEYNKSLIRKPLSKLPSKIL